MLLRFRVANVRSIRDEQELSFVVQPGDAAPSARQLAVGGSRELAVYPLVGIFGANASGKPNDGAIIGPVSRLRSNDPIVEVTSGGYSDRQCRTTRSAVCGWTRWGARCGEAPWSPTERTGALPIGLDQGMSMLSTMVVIYFLRAQLY
jgi:hypothetical protein